LATAWLLGALPSFALVVVRTMSHAWNQDVQYVWEWFVPALFPTLSLVITSMAAAAFEPTAPAKELQPRAFFFRLTLGVSALYLMALTAIVLVAARAQTIDVIRSSAVYLGALQTLCTATLGVFFSTRK
jgi:hypothetical protein